MALDSEVREYLDSLLKDNNVVLFMKGNRAQPQCGFSAKSIAALDTLVSDYVTIDVLQNQAVREGIKEYGEWPTIPQLYIEGELVGGWVAQMVYQNARALLESLSSGGIDEVDLDERADQLRRLMVSFGELTAAGK